MERFAIRKRLVAATSCAFCRSAAPKPLLYTNFPLRAIATDIPGTEYGRMKPQPIRFISPSSRPVGPPSRLCVAQAAFTTTGVRPAAAAPSSLVIAARRLMASIISVLLPCVEVETTISIERLIENRPNKKGSNTSTRAPKLRRFYNSRQVRCILWRAAEEVRGSNERSPHTVLTWIVLSIALLRRQRLVITGAAFRQASRQRRGQVDALLQGSERLNFNEVA